MMYDLYSMICDDDDSAVASESPVTAAVVLIYYRLAADCLDTRRLSEERILLCRYASWLLRLAHRQRSHSLPLVMMHVEYNM